MEVNSQGPDHKAKRRPTNNAMMVTRFLCHQSIINMLEQDTLVAALGFLDWKGILNARVSKKLKEASLITPVPGTLTIRSAKLGQDLTKIASALPHVQSMELCGDDDEGVVVDEGEGPFKRRRQIPNTNLEDLLNFSNLEELAFNLSVPAGIGLNGSYPVLYDLKGLQKLVIRQGSDFRLNLYALSSNLTNLRHLECTYDSEIVGNLGTLRPLRDTLETLDLEYQFMLTGSITDLADFPRLQELYLVGCTAVEGDIRDIRPHHFPSLKSMRLFDSNVDGITIESVADATAIMSTWGRLLITHTCLEFDQPRLVVRLSESSPDRWEGSPGQQLDIEIIRAPGNRIGWRWTNALQSAHCDMNWISPEPQPGENDYDEYIQYRTEIEEEQMNSLFRGFTRRPPTEEEHRELQHTRASAFASEFAAFHWA